MELNHKKLKTPLDTESPDFDAQFAAVIQQGYAAVNRSIRSSNVLPTGAARELFTTFPVFHSVIHKLRAHATRQLAKAVGPGHSVRKTTEYDIDKIIEINDNILERVLAGVEGKTAVLIPTNTNTPVPSRPQLLFEDRVDNTQNVFVPKITLKHNATETFVLKPVRTDDGELIGYEHPYQAELEAYTPPAHFLIDDGEPINAPPPLSRTPFTLVTTKQQLEDLVNHLATVEEIAVDVEHHSLHSYQGFTCLVQISTSRGDWVVDALALRSHLHALNAAFTDPTKLKVFHGADNDVIWLQRDFGLYLVGLFDTHQAARTLCLPRLSLQHLLSRYCGLDVDKSLARADWRQRPLPQPMLDYARGDTNSLLYIWRRMRRELLDAAPGSGALRSVFAASQRVAARIYSADSIERESWSELESRASRYLDARQRAALLALHRWRDGVARATDESPTFIAPSHTLLALSNALPRELQGAAALCACVPRLRPYLPHIHRLLLACRELPAGEPAALSTRAVSTPAPHLQPSTSPHDLPAPPTPRDLPTPAATLSHKPLTATFTPDVTVFSTSPSPVGEKVVRRVTRFFVPPYDRYRTYRYLAQVEEMKQYKAKAAKAAAIAKEDKDLIPSPAPPAPIHEYVPPEKRLRT